jgi:hypothetical protein
MAKASQLLAWSAVSLGWGLVGFYVGRLRPQDNHAMTRLIASAGSQPVTTQSVTHAHTGPSVEQVHKLSSLVTMKVEVADAQVTSVQGQTGGMRVALLVRGDFLIGVDLSQARFEQVDHLKRTVVLVLPQPRAASPRLNHERTKVFEVTSHGLWLLVPGDAGRAKALELAHAEAQRLVAEAATSASVTGRARSQAESVLGSFFDAAGWTISVRWVQ